MLRIITVCKGLRNTLEKKLTEGKETGIKKRIMPYFALISIFSIITIGCVSYSISKTSINSKVVSASQNIIEQANLSITQQMKGIENTILKFEQEDFLNALEKSLTSKNVTEIITAQTEISKIISLAETSNKSLTFLSFIDRNMTTSGRIPPFAVGDSNKSIRDKFIEAGKANDGKGTWLTHTDSKVNLIYAKGVNSKRTGEYLGTVITIYNVEKMLEVYNTIDLGKGSKIFTMNYEGKVITAKSNSTIEKIYTESDFINRISNEKNKTSGSFRFSDSEGKKLIIYSRLLESNMYNIAIIPTSIYTANLVVMLAVLALIGTVCFTISLIISGSIAKSIIVPLKEFSDFIKRVGGGDLSLRIQDLSKDEIGTISRDFNEMLEKTSMLINNMKIVADNIINSSREIDESAKSSSYGLEQVGVTMEQIAEGSKNQAEEILEGLTTMETLSERINEVTEKMSTTSGVMDKTQKNIAKAVTNIKALNIKSEETSKFSMEIIDEIKDLSNNMLEIKNIINLIMGISSQTNLLSLNAAIEATKAGQAGRGFSVVADEVRKLADQSKKASIKIADIINEIAIKTELVVEEANNSNSIIQKQMAAVISTNDTFNTMGNATGRINEKIEKMKNAAEGILNLKNKTMITMEEISAISEETSSITQNVSACTEEQIAGVQQLSALIETLNSLSQELNSTIARFTLI